MPVVAPGPRGRAAPRWSPVELLAPLLVLVLGRPSCCCPGTRSGSTSCSPPRSPGCRSARSSPRSCSGERHHRPTWPACRRPTTPRTTSSSTPGCRCPGWAATPRCACCRCWRPPAGWRSSPARSPGWPAAPPGCSPGTVLAAQPAAARAGGGGAQLRAGGPGHRGAALLGWSAGCRSRRAGSCCSASPAPAMGLAHWYAVTVLAAFVVAALLLRGRRALPVVLVGAVAALPDRRAGRR